MSVQCNDVPTDVSILLYSITPWDSDERSDQEFGLVYFQGWLESLVIYLSNSNRIVSTASCTLRILGASLVSTMRYAQFVTYLSMRD